MRESEIEEFAIRLLQEQGYDHIHAAEGGGDERRSFADVLLLNRLRDAVRRINPDVPPTAQDEAIADISRVHSQNLGENNEHFHRRLTNGVPVNVTRNGERRGDLVFLLDFDRPQNNDFLVVSQFTVKENDNNRRPDLVLFVNGIPLVVIELKNPVAEKVTLLDAFNQLQNYKRDIPALFVHNALLVISDGMAARAGTVSSAWNRFMAWKSEDGVAVAPPTVPQMQTLIKGMLNKATLLDLIRHFIVYEDTADQADQAGCSVVVRRVKKAAAYHQYYAVNRAVQSTLRAAAMPTGVFRAEESPPRFALPDVKEQDVGDRRGGVVWHTQGSGKSLSMLFYVGKIVLQMDNPTVLMLTDRNDLDGQLFGVFAASKELLRQQPQQAESREHLKRLLSVPSGGVVFATMQKFYPQGGGAYDCLSDRTNIVVVADEAHRTQYGFKAKTREVKDAAATAAAAANVVGVETRYGFAKHLRDALPRATYIGFTGTPIEKEDANTPAVFGNYVDIYDVAQAVEDGATVPIFYESRLAKVDISEEGRALIEKFEREREAQADSPSEEQKARWTRLEALVGSDDRIRAVAADIVAHFEARERGMKGKGMVVCMSRRLAVALYDAIVAVRPRWHSRELHRGAIKVVMTSQASDAAALVKHHTSKSERDILNRRMKADDDELRLVIVCDMWLTGFDAPCLHTLYLDKPMRGHNLMQAIARVNRVHQDKPAGLVVDYLGIAADLRQALSFYANAGGRGDPAQAQEKAVEVMLEKLEVVQQLFHGFPYRDYFSADIGEKLSIMLAAVEHVLGVERGKKRFADAVTALSRAFAVSIPREEALQVKDEVAFFQAVKARLLKLAETKDGGGGGAMAEETLIRQVINEALRFEKVVDIYDAAGLKKPDISVLSDEFMAELKNMKRKNIALEVLKKILRDEIRKRKRTNLVQSRSLMERLEAAVLQYQNNVRTAAEVIEELIAMSKDIIGMDADAKTLKLNPFEYAFYGAVAANDSAMELMGKDKLRELAVVLTDKVRKNATIDWTIRENVRARLRVNIRKILRDYGYPPDMEKLATDTVLKQAELIADDLTRQNATG